MRIPIRMATIATAVIMGTSLLTSCSDSAPVCNPDDLSAPAAVLAKSKPRPPSRPRSYTKPKPKSTAKHSTTHHSSHDDNDCD